MFSIKYTQPVLETLKELWDSDEESAAVIAIALEDLETNEDFLASMFQHQHRQLYPEPSIESERVTSLWNRGYNIIRLKIWDYKDAGGRLLPYRILVGYDGCETYYVLACAPRDSAYVWGHSETQRILEIYEELDLPTN